MPKRAAEPPVSPALKNRSREAVPDDGPAVAVEMGEFEDKYEDEFESESEVLEAGDDGGDDEGSGGAKMDVDRQVYLPSRRVLGKDEVLEPDTSAYEMLYSMNSNWPCLSFDVLRDGLGDERRGYPQTVFMVAGTQAARAKENEVTVMKLSGLQKIQQGLKMLSRFIFFKKIPHTPPGHFPKQERDSYVH